jgi:hypothetical protein
MWGQPWASKPGSPAASRPIMTRLSGASPSLLHGARSLGGAEDRRLARTITVPLSDDPTCALAQPIIVSINGIETRSDRAAPTSAARCTSQDQLRGDNGRCHHIGRTIIGLQQLLQRRSSVVGARSDRRSSGRRVPPVRKVHDRGRSGVYDSPVSRGAGSAICPDNVVGDRNA